ncbi:D-2-hydroxyacid dehydrogenase [Natronospora cellulosivora (SeqCode)]
MKIAILDGYTLNPGDLSWEGFKALGDVALYDRTPVEKILERAKGARVIIINKTPISRETIEVLPDLKYIGVLATGYNVVDIEAAKEKNIPVCNIPTYGTASVAQFVFALLLELCHHVQKHSDAVKNDEWSECADFCFWKNPLVELSGKTMGIIGFGRIGEQTANIAEAFGMKLIAFDSYQSNQSHRNNFKWAGLDELLSQADVVSLHCPLFPETKGIINKNKLNKMKKTAFLINTSRGSLVVEQDLADALNNGIIAGAGLDVLALEPASKDNPLLQANNCIITPHIAWATKEARSRLMDLAVENLKSFLEGNPVNVVNV